jgi:uncharacterized protein (TIGR03437 family)
VAGIVNASNYAAGPFAPNSVLAIFGTGLARSTHLLVNDDLVDCKSTAFKAKCLPLEMNYVRAYVQDQPVPLLFVSPGQVNFLISSTEKPGPVKFRLVTQGITGPEVTITLADVAPALFPNPLAPGYAIAQDVKGNLLTPDNPAHPGDTIVIYATGLGQTSPNPAMGEIPTYAAPMLRFSTSFIGAGPNDVTAGQEYSGTGLRAMYFTVQIDRSGTPDTFRWQKGTGAFTNGVPTTGAAQTLSDGVIVTFLTTHGHKLADQWQINIAATPVVTLNGDPVAPSLIKYAGLTPWSAGLYQINLYLPESAGNDPEIGVIAGSQAAQSGLKLPVR